MNKIKLLNSAWLNGSCEESSLQTSSEWQFFIWEKLVGVTIQKADTIIPYPTKPIASNIPYILIV